MPILFASLFCCAAALHAQTAASSETKGYADVNVGATFGHKSDVSVGGEAGWAVMRDLDVFFEAGHIGNAASSDLDTRANNIANNIGGTANVIAKVNYFDAGVRYRFVVNNPKIRPYVAAGFGAAHVTTQTTVSINGSTAPPELIAFGTDLNGSQTAPELMLGGGATVDVATRYFVDVSYRFARIFQRSEQSGGDTIVTLAAFNTNRLQVGLGIKF
ncbi:MAG TPA: hypothetical protein VFA27_17625 [Vicinamibacterales bacterium]|nr:hypothetical protein [Vicinamibacterales bacterium]